MDELKIQFHGKRCTTYTHICSSSFRASTSPRWVWKGAKDLPAWLSRNKSQRKDETFCGSNVKAPLPSSMSSSHTSKKGHQKSFKILLSTRHGYDIISNFLLVSEKCRHLSEPRDTVAILGKAQIEKVVENACSRLYWNFNTSCIFFPFVEAPKI